MLQSIYVYHRRHKKEGEKVYKPALLARAAVYLVASPEALESSEHSGRRSRTCPVSHSVSVSALLCAGLKAGFKDSPQTASPRDAHLLQPRALGLRPSDLSPLPHEGGSSRTLGSAFSPCLFFKHPTHFQRSPSCPVTQP